MRELCLGLMLIGKERSELYVGLMLIGKGEEGVCQESKCEGVLLRVFTCVQYKYVRSY
jgi:hypothetical protein